MKIHIALVLLACAGKASASGMSPIDESSGYCKGKDGICYEWQLASDPLIRFIAYGGEQGIDYSFYKANSGQYQQLVRIHPILLDPKHPDNLYWGYPQDVRDVSVTADGQIQASFSHGVVDDGEVYSPEWQKHVPAVLFLGSTTQPQMRIKPIVFQPYKLETLRKKAGG